MRFIHIDEAGTGMVLAKPLYNVNTGVILLRANIELTPVYIRKMKEMGYEYICIREKDEPEDTPKLDPIREETRAKGLKIVKDTMAQLTQNTVYMDTARIYTTIEEIISQILFDPKVGFDLVQIRNLDNYLFMHSMNICVIAIMIGSLLNLGRNQLEMLGAGAILHDVGYIEVDPQILKKPDKLSPEEYEVVKNHAKAGFDILKTRVSLSFLSAHVAYQHHEREDGSGYPRGLKSGQIHSFAKITAVADAYDALISPHSFRLAVTAPEAVATIQKDAPLKFDAGIVEKLAQIVIPDSQNRPPMR